jgi:holliday junction DNA helicase RuvA
MIAYVTGTLAAKAPTEVVIEAGGLGYTLLIPASSYERLPAVGKPAKLLAHFQVREDAHLLFGFATEAERTLFRAMISVSGVGPKLALAALSSMAPDALRDLILEGDTSLLTRIPGVGKKTAERLVIELRDRLVDLDGIAPASGTADADGATVRADARAALEALGLARAEAEKRIRKALRDAEGPLSAEALIRKALQGG